MHRSANTVLSLSYVAHVDGNRIADGLEVTQQLITDAYRILATYAAGDRAVVNAMLSTIVTKIDASADRDAEGKLTERYLIANGYREPQTSFLANREHIDANRDSITALTRTPEHHQPPTEHDRGRDA